MSFDHKAVLPKHQASSQFITNCGETSVSCRRQTSSDCVCSHRKVLYTIGEDFSEMNFEPVSLNIKMHILDTVFILILWYRRGEFVF